MIIIIIIIIIKMFVFIFMKSFCFGTLNEKEEIVIRSRRTTSLRISE